MYSTNFVLGQGQNGELTLMNKKLICFIIMMFEVTTINYSIEFIQNGRKL